MNIEDIKLISDDNIAKLSSALDAAMDDIKDHLGDERLRSDMYVYLLQMGAIIGHDYMHRERVKSQALLSDQEMLAAIK